MTRKMDTVFDELIDVETLLANGQTMDPTVYQYYKGLSKRRIIINSDISCDILEYALLPLIEMDSDGTGNPIDIYLFTGGGHVYAGFALCDMIDRVQTPLTVHIVGMAASMGMMIAMAGCNNPNVTTVCHEHAVGLIHSGSIQLGEMSSNAAYDVMEFHKKYEDRIRKYVISHSKITAEFYEQIGRKEFWMDSDQMLEYGIVDKITS